MRWASCKNQSYKRCQVSGLHWTDVLFSRLTKDTARFKDELDIMKFICKDFWTCVFKKQIDNLRTNHQVNFDSCSRRSLTYLLIYFCLVSCHSCPVLFMFVYADTVVMCFRVSMFSRTISSDYWVSCQPENSTWNKPQRCSYLTSFSPVVLITFLPP